MGIFGRVTGVELCIVCIEVMADAMSLDNVGEGSGIECKEDWAENRTLRNTTI